MAGIRKKGWRSGYTQEGIPSEKSNSRPNDKGR